MECEINFANIGENTTLEELFMDRMTLYKNVQVSFDGAITYVDWDTVNFADQVGELAKLKGLKKLSIQGNQLTDLEFASSLKTLVSIDFSDNYVTDLEPLVGLTALKEVSCRENPISNYEVLKDSVVVLSDTQK